MSNKRFPYMSVKAIYINLPISNVEKSRSFWKNLGFDFNESYSDEKALCLVLNEGLMYAMLITQSYFETFTNRPVFNGSTSQVLLAIEVSDRQSVDRMVKLALENGATRYREKADHGWMYYDSFADPDGHQWEVMCTQNQSDNK